MPFPRHAGTEPPVASRCRRPPGVRTEPGIPPSCRSRLVRAVPRAPALSGLAPPEGGGAPADVREGGNPGLPPPCGRIARAGADPRAGRAVALAGTAHSSCGRRFPRHGRRIPRAASSAIRLRVAPGRCVRTPGPVPPGRTDLTVPGRRPGGWAGPDHGMADAFSPRGRGSTEAGQPPFPAPRGVRTPERRPGNVGERMNRFGSRPRGRGTGSLADKPVSVLQHRSWGLSLSGRTEGAVTHSRPASRHADGGHHACRFRHDCHPAPIGGCRVVPGCRRGDHRREP